MKMKANKRHDTRQRRLRHKLLQIEQRKYRLTVSRSHLHIYGQVVDHAKGYTVVAMSTLNEAVKSQHKKGGNVAAAKAVGLALAKAALKAGIDPKEVSFNRNGYNYHGRVKALAEGAREGGLLF